MQRIYFGAPGTGKSFTIEDNVLSDVSDNCVFRVTFYPDFSYNDFVGQLLPVVETDDTTGAEKITYSFTKGIFTKALEKAYEDAAVNVYLIIEEMSRGDCAAIFGDIFQLLDRENRGIYKGYSKYSINNSLIAKDIVELNNDKVKLPPNFHIIGTVNTCDQNVYVMDTAFKRRFEWEYISTEPVSSEDGTLLNNAELRYNNGTVEKTINWVDLYQKLNTFISEEQYLDLGEDKQLGQFFIEFDLSQDYETHKKQIQNKLLNYLWNDVAKASFKNDIRLFDSSIGSFSKLYSSYAKGIKVFSDDFITLMES